MPEPGAFKFSFSNKLLFLTNDFLQFIVLFVLPFSLLRLRGKDPFSLFGLVLFLGGALFDSFEWGLFVFKSVDGVESPVEHL